MKSSRNSMALTGLSTAIAGLIYCAAISQAQEIDMSWRTVDGGGDTSTGGGFTISGTIGQPDAGEALTGNAFALTGGFWPIANTCFCPGDLNGDGKRDGRDVQDFTFCMTSGRNCNCADADQIGGVNLADVPIFVGQLLAGANCP